MEVEKSTLVNLKQVGRKNQTYDQLIQQRITCDAAGCKALGSLEISVSAGKFGAVKLFVCPNCVGKFTE
jgi:hypothetical protein